MGRLALIIDNKHYINAIKLHCHLLVLDGIYVTICWTSDDCDGQVDLKLHLSVGQVILFPYFDTRLGISINHLLFAITTSQPNINTPNSELVSSLSQS